ncbi:hypothetical protein [Bradyrhizobium sp. SYSU BS000235]|uniref:hypothetical protein n=1 Tax=Bradyrhizobium sp. SYSU BS000235 TaxID=3411332 RepID=UPI003C78D8FE
MTENSDDNTDPKESSAQVGRYFAQTFMFRALMEVIAEELDISLQDVQDRTLAKVTAEIAGMKLHAIGRPDRQAAMAKFDLAIKAIFDEYPAETQQ